MENIKRTVLLCLLFLYTCSGIICQAATFGNKIILTEAAPAFYLENKKSPSWINMPYYQYDIDFPPYVNREKLKIAEKRFLKLVERQKNAGYTAIVIGDLIRFVTLEKFNVFSKSSAEYKRVLIYRNFFNQLISECDLDVYVVSDFQPLTREIESCLGALDPASPILRNLNKEMLKELFTSMPGVKGIIIRTGEGGEKYSATTYYSKIIYQKIDDTQILIEDLLDVCKEFDKSMIYRIWSIGIGETGDISGNPQMYEKVLSPFYDEKNLIISIKPGAGDFFRYLETNPTLGTGKLPQIVEFQLRREYEGFGTLTNFITPVYQKTIRQQTESNPNFAGVYSWTLTGGWDDANNLPFFKKSGLWIEIDNNILPKIVQHPYTDPVEKAHEFLSERFDKNTADAVLGLLQSSGKIIRDIFYADEYAADDILMRGLALPKIQWLFWDIPSGDYLSLFQITSRTTDIEREIIKTENAYYVFKNHKNNILNNLTDSTAEPYDFLYENLNYQDRMLKILTLYKSLFLYYFKYLENGNLSYLKSTMRLLPDVTREINSVENDYRASTTHPPLNFSNAKRLMKEINTHPQRKKRSFFAAIGFFLITCLVFAKWRKNDTRRTYLFLLLFCLLAMNAASAFVGHPSPYYFIFAGIFISSLIFMGPAGQRLFSIDKMIEKETSQILLNTLFFSSFLTIFISFFLRFRPERMWLIIDRIATGPWMYKGALILIISASFFISMGIKFKKYHLNIADLLKVSFSGFVTTALFFVVAWELFLFRFDQINNILNLFPDILIHSGSGTYLIDQLSIFNHKKIIVTILLILVTGVLSRRSIFAFRKPENNHSLNS